MRCLLTRDGINRPADLGYNHFIGSRPQQGQFFQCPALPVIARPQILAQAQSQRPLLPMLPFFLRPSSGLRCGSALQNAAAGTGHGVEGNLGVGI